MNPWWPVPPAPCNKAMRREETPQPNREEMTQLVLSLSRLSSRQETVPVSQAVGRVLAKEARAVHTLPNRPVSSMDGIAYRYEDYLACGGDCRGWQQQREYEFSNTGVAVPEHLDTVSLIEDVAFDQDQRLTILRPPAGCGDNIRPAGSRLQAGQLLIAADTVLTPSHLGLLASAGLRQVAVYRRPQVAIIPTGDELIPAGLPLPPGKNVECNSLVLSALIQSWGGQPVVYPIIPDDLEQLTNVTRQAVADYDMVVFNAGSSKGRKDFAAAVLNRIGEVYVYEVGHGPGKHTSFALADNNTPVLGLVGPTGGAELTARWYLRPLIYRYLHKPLPAPELLPVRLMEQVKAHVPFDFYMQLVVYAEEDGRYCAWAGGGPGRGGAVNGSGHCPNAVLHIPGGKIFAPGEVAEVELQVPRCWLPSVTQRGQ